MPTSVPSDDAAAIVMLQAEAEQRGHQRGSSGYRRSSLALFLAGFATFSLLYCVQPLLPAFAQDYRIVPATAALALSVTTGALAVAILASGALGPLLPRRGLMFGSMALAAACNLLAAAAQDWPQLLLARAVEGFVLGGVPAVAMAYLAEEIDARDLGRAMGVYVAGTAFGGMTGRVGMGLLTAVTSWRWAMAAIGLVGLACAIGFAWLLPASRRFMAERGFDGRRHLRAWTGHLRDRDPLRLFAIAFVLMSVFVTVFNYAGFRLAAAPFGLGQSTISLLFLSYISGIVVSPLAGQLADRRGRRRPLVAALILVGGGALLTWPPSLATMALGILLITIGFFAAHAVASGWVGQLGGETKGHAASLYLLFYYLGSSVTGSGGGRVWQAFGWPGVVVLAMLLAVMGLVLAAGLHERRPARVYPSDPAGNRR